MYLMLRHGSCSFEALCVGNWISPFLLEAKIASMAEGRVQYFSGLRSRMKMGEKDTLNPSGYVNNLCQERQLKEALGIMDLMMMQGIPISINTYGCLLQECSKMQFLSAGKRVHASIIKSGFESHTFLANTLVDMYGNCRSVLNARQVFDRMTERNIFSWTAIISAYAKQGQAQVAISLFQQMQQTGLMPDKVLLIIVLKAYASMAALEGGKQIHVHIIRSGFECDSFVRSALVDMYAKCGSIQDARQVFGKICERNVVIWNAMIGGYVQQGHGKEALTLFKNMKLEGIMPDNVTYVNILKACTSLEALELGKEVHAQVIASGFASDTNLGNTLIDMYAKCGRLDYACQVFNKMCKRNVISWTVLIAGYVQQGHADKALMLFEQMQQEGVKPDSVILVSILKACGSLGSLKRGKQIHAFILKSGLDLDAFVGSTLVDMYAKCGSIKDAYHVFNKMCHRDLVSWTAMITGCVQQGHTEEALFLFEKMQQEGVKPDIVTFVSILKACANLTALERGKQVHAQVIKNGYESDVFVGSALVDMYAKCGKIENACQVFNRIRERGVVPWNAMIAGYAQQGLGERALLLFKQMQEEGVKPDDVTFICILSACSHTGLVDEGCRHFGSMSQDHGIPPATPHYACMVDLFGRAGHLSEAGEFIYRMPFQPDAVVWMTLLDACRRHGSVELGRYAFKCILRLEPKRAGSYMLLSSIYAAVDRWDEVAKIREIMDNAGVRKELRCSWIEANDEVHTFSIAERTHPQSREIQAELKRLIGLIKEAGYVPDLGPMLHDMVDVQKEDTLYDHSEL